MSQIFTLFQRIGVMENTRPMKTSSSNHTDFKKCMEVTTDHHENQVFSENETNCHLNKMISNVGGPGDAVQAQQRRLGMITGIKKRLEATGQGLDKKHGSYERYLARKKGWFFRNEFKHCHQ